MTRYSSFAMLAGGTGLENAGPLDGRSYAIRYKTDGGWFSRKDTLTFRQGKLYSAACGAGAYSALEARDFHASADEGRVEWRGRVDGDEIEGTFVWRKPGKLPVQYSFSGRR